MTNEKILGIALVLALTLMIGIVSLAEGGLNTTLAILQGQSNVQNNHFQSQFNEGSNAFK
jgi:hypothetical protein